MNSYFFQISNNWEDKVEKIIPYLQNPDKPLIIFLSGPTGVGKSSISIELCHFLGIRNNICTDILRILLASKNPILQYFSHECWKQYGKYTEENMINGFRKQSEIVCDGIDFILKDAMRHKKNTVIEGIHLLPSFVLKKQDIFAELRMIFIYIMTDFEFFNNVLLPNRVVSTYRHRKLSDYDEERLLKYRIFNNMWKYELEKYDIEAVFNFFSPENLMTEIFNKIIFELERK